MKNFLYKKREALAVILYLVFIAVLIYFVILPLLSKITKINDEIQQEVMKQENVKIHIDELPIVQKQYAVLQEKGDLSNILLDRNKAVLLIEKIEKLAEKTNNKISISIEEKALTKVAPKKITKDGPQAEETIVDKLPSTDYLQINIKLTGDYLSIVSFVNMLETFEYYNDIIAIQINSGDKLDSSSQNSKSSGMFGGNIPINTNENIAQDNTQDNISELSASLNTIFYTN